VSLHSATKPWWQQATALVTVSTGGMITGFTFAPGAAATMTSPAGMPVHLMALEKASQPAQAADSADAALRSAVVNVAKYYLQLAQTRTPAQMEALIWGKDSVDGADHGQSCAAFASLTLELGAQAVGQQSWVTGGGSYPWPVHSWVDSRVDPNPDSPGITSVLQDAQAHGRWHPLGDGYQPQPGDWVMFDQHVEVVTGYANGVLDTIGGDSLPNYSVNAHTFRGSLSEDGVAGFIDNGNLASAGHGTTAQSPAGQGSASHGLARQGSARQGPAGNAPAGQASSGRVPAAKGGSSTALPDIPGASAPQPSAAPATGPAPKASGTASAASGPRAAAAAIPGLSVSGEAASTGHESAVIPGLAPAPASTPPASSAPASTAQASGAPASAKPTSGVSQGKYQQHNSAEPASAPTTKTQQAFLSAVAPGAIAAQQRYGVPAAVTIAQAIEESAWGQSGLATQYHNLFGIKGTGPAGSVSLPTQEYAGGQWKTIDAPFRVYHNIAESISDHAELLATSGYYTHAMSDRAFPDAFANDLTGIYATDPDYGANLISLMRLYDLYRYDSPARSSGAQGVPTAQPHTTPSATPTQAGTTTLSGTPAPSQTPAPTSTPTPAGTPGPTAAAAPAPAPAGVPAPVPTAAPTRVVPAHTAPAHTAPRAVKPAPEPSYQGTRSQGTASIPGLGTPGPTSYKATKYQSQVPPAVTTAIYTSAKMPLAHAEQMHREVASRMSISWKLLAACDWMQCQAHPRYSPVHGEKLGTVNADGSIYQTKSEALAQCAADMIQLAGAVYGIDLRVPQPMSIRALAEVFAAFRWGGLLRKHGVSAMEFPYSVAGLTEHHAKMHWPAISERDAPDKPGGKFKMPFGAVPVVLSLKYPATV
jgi:flagellum-specific peptidoglycan hydrolase FlgJ